MRDPNVTKELPVFPLFISLGHIRELTQRRRRRLRNRPLKSEFALPQTLSRIFHVV